MALARLHKKAQGSNLSEPVPRENKIEFELDLQCMFMIAPFSILWETEYNYAN